MTPEALDLSNRIVEYLRSRREPATASEVKFVVSEPLFAVVIALKALVATGEVVVSEEPPNGRSYYRIARSS